MVTPFILWVQNGTKHSVILDTVISMNMLPSFLFITELWKLSTLCLWEEKQHCENSFFVSCVHDVSNEHYYNYTTAYYYENDSCPKRNMYSCSLKHCYFPALQALETYWKK